MNCNLRQLSVVSVFRPQEVSYSGIQLVGRSIQEVVSELEANGISAEQEDAGYLISQASVLLVEVAGVVGGIELHPS